MQRLVNVSDHQLLVLYKAVHALPDHAQAFLQCLLEGTTDRHHLADRLHAGSQLTGHPMEFAQVPTRNLADHIV